MRRWKPLMLWTAFVLLLLFFLTAATQSAPDTTNIADATRMEWKRLELPAARVGWLMAQLCLNRPMEYPKDLPEIYIVRGVAFRNEQGELVIGYADWKRKPKLYISEAYVNVPVVWAHEVSHILLREGDHLGLVWGRCQFDSIPARTQ